MDCRETRERLSEYIDGMLSKDAASRLKNHLDRCAACSEAHRSTMKIIGHMQKMERIEEPADFLEKVNARMDRRFSPGGIIRRLFRPMGIKIPLELAAAAAVIALIVYLGGVKEPKPLYQITITESEMPLVASDDLRESEEAEIPVSAPIDSKLFAQTAEEPPPEQDKADKTEGVKRYSAPAVSETKKISGTAEKSVSDERKLDKTSDAARESAPAAEQLHYGKAATRGKKGPAGEPSLQKTIRSLGGNIIETEYLEGTDTPARMIIEIPVGKFESLIQELVRRGEIQAPPTEIKRKADEFIRVELIFQRPKP